jgi:hypothetical protein
MVQNIKLNQSFKDGKVLVGLISSIYPLLMDMKTLDMSNPLQLNKDAIKLAEEKLHIPAFVEAEDLMNEPDETLVLSYLSYFRNCAFIKEFLQNLSSKSVQIPELDKKKENETSEEKSKRLWKTFVRIIVK